MKNLSNFEAFKLNKDQMNAISGGVACAIDFGDGQILLTAAPKDLTVEEAQASLEKSYGNYATVKCK